MRRNTKLKALIIGSAIFLSSMFSVNAYAAYPQNFNVNGGKVNTQFTTKIGETVPPNYTLAFEGWYSGWGKQYNFAYTGASDYEIVTGANATSYFSGTSKAYPKSLKASFSLPDDVKKFVDLYGADKLGVKLTLGDGTNISNNSCRLDIKDGKLHVEFKVILKYLRTNMWAFYNSSIANKFVSGHYYNIPQSTGTDARNFISTVEMGSTLGLKLDEYILRNANQSGSIYSVGAKLTKDSASHTTMLGSYGSKDEKTVDAKNYTAACQVISNGGANGVGWYFPLKVEYYAATPEAEMRVEDYEYYEPSTGVYWVKAGDKFNIVAKGRVDAIDDFVQPTANLIRFWSNDGQGVSVYKKYAGAVNAHQHDQDSGGQYYVTNYDYTSNTDPDKTYTTSSYRSISGDNQYLVDSKSVMYAQKSGTLDDKNIYKESSYTGQTKIYSDSKAPTIVKGYENQISQFYDGNKINNK